MSDIAILAASVKTSLLEIARQAGGLGIGLQNAAPSEKADRTSNPSVQYLLDTADQLNKLAEDCSKFL